MTKRMDEYAPGRALGILACHTQQCLMVTTRAIRTWKRSRMWLGDVWAGRRPCNRFGEDGLDGCVRRVTCALRL